MREREGKDWRSLADEAAQEAMTLDLCLKTGSVVWDGDAFTAETPDRNPVPRDKRGRRLVSGRLFSSNGFPARVEYGFDGQRYVVSYTYDAGGPDSGRLPKTINIVEHFLASGASNDLTLELLAYRATNLGVSAIQPETGMDQ